MGNTHAHKKRAKEVEGLDRQFGKAGDSAASSDSISTPVVPSIGSGTVGEEDLALLQASWQWLKDAGMLGRLGANHFRRFFDQAEDVARILYVGTNMGRQVHVVTPVVEFLIHNRGDEAVHALGMFHAHLGVTPAQLGTFGKCFVASVMELLPPMYQRAAVEAAWAASMTHLVEQIGKHLTEAKGALEKMGEEKSAASKVEAHQAMRLRTTSDRLKQLNKPDAAGWLKVSMYAASRTKPPKQRGQHQLEAFRSRWCELKGQYLIYRVYEQDKPAGVVDLSQCELVDTSTHQSHLPSPSPYSFALLNYNTPKHPWYFLCDGDEEKELWYAGLRRACNRFSFIRSDLFKGQRVRALLQDAQTAGVCVWIGKHPKEDGLWVGLETDDPAPGGTDGKFDHKRYFKCEDGKGLLLPAFRVAALTPLEIQVEGGGDAVLPLNTYSPSQFEFLTVLGKGSFGRVCKVREAATGKIFAIKILQKAALVKESQITSVRREKSILLHINHPFIVKLHAAFQSHGRLFLLFDFLTGGELFAYVQGSQGGYLPERSAAFYLAEVALALDHIHAMNIIHRDLKAENLVLDKHGHVVLTDFGFAKTLDAGDVTTTRCGTLPYMAPEILKQTAMGYGLEVDWWALGVLTFLLLTGCYPFWDPAPRETMKQIVTRVIEMHTFPVTPELSPNARDLNLRLIDKNPATRLRSLAELKKHPWFTGFDWDGCLERTLTPPFVPDHRGANTKYFDTEGRAGVEGTSKALPQGYSKQQNLQFSSFRDVHVAYRHMSNAEGHEDTDEEDNKTFLQDMNAMRPGGSSSDERLPGVP